MNHLIFALFCIIFGWGSVAFGQNNNSETLVISTEGLTHNRISIKDIFLSSNGLDTGGSASIQLLGEIGTVKSKVLEATTSAKVQGLILQDRGCSTKDPNKKCILATDASGKVHVVTNFDEIYTVGGSNGGVFQRGTDHTDAYFADQQGNLAPVGKTQQILRVGVNSDNRRGSLKDDAALLVGGSVETRGGVLIKKIDNLLANTGSNKDLDINSRPYTSLDTTVNNGNINFQSFKKDERQDYPTQFLFTNKSATHPTKVGINTSNPSSALTVGRGGDITLVADSNGNPNDAGDLIFKKANGSQNARIRSNNDGGLFMGSTTNTPQIALTNNGNIGIGTTTPSEKLHVNGNIRAQGNLISDGANMHIIRPDAPGGFARGLQMINPNGGGPEATMWFLGAGNQTSAIYFWYGDNARDNPGLTVKKSRKVGIGVSGWEEPEAKLDVRGDARIEAGLKVGGTRGWWLGGKLNYSMIEAITPQHNGHYSPYLKQTMANGNVVNLWGLGNRFGFVSYNADRTANGVDHFLLTMDSVNGNVGIGTFDPGEKLHVNGNMRANGTVSAQNKMVIEQSGLTSPELAIGNPDNPFASLLMNGVYNASPQGSRWSPLSLSLAFNINNQRKGITIYREGDVNITRHLAIGWEARANAYFYNSDKRYKTDIQPLESALAKITSIGGYKYFNTLTQKNDIGLIAQDVEQTFPELVATDAQGYKTVAYANLVAPLVEAIKELNTTVQHLFDQYLSQQAQIDALEARIQALEQK